MSYELKLEGTIVTAVKYFSPGKFTRRSSNGMKRWMSRQLEYDKDVMEIPGIRFTQWLSLIKHKRLIVEEL